MQYFFLLFLFLLTICQADMINSSFESSFSGWTVTGDAYIAPDRTPTGGGDFADRWFSGGPKDGTRYACIGNRGNESSGTLKSPLWTATNQYLSFYHAGNSANNHFAAILNSSSVQLTYLYAQSYNDSVWRRWDFNLQSLGLKQGDSFYFFYQDGSSWSVVDYVYQWGNALPSVPENSSILFLGMGLLFLIRKFL